MKYTLITGASSGIGLELAKVCARHHQNLILSARSVEKLNSLKQELIKEFKVQVECIPCDLSLPEGATKLFSEVTSKKLLVDILVNNAGLGDHGPFIDSSWERQNEMIQVNITSLTHLTHLFLPFMIQQKSGRILNVASTAAFQPGPLMAVYYATKSYVLHFSEALKEELVGTGVSITTLCPGPTQSGFQAKANFFLNQSKVSLIQWVQIPTSKEVAEYAFKQLMHRKPLAVHGVANNFVVQMIRFLPRSIVRKLVKRLQEKRKKE